MSTDKLVKSEAEWRAQLTPEQFSVAREGGTEAPFTGRYDGDKTPGTFACVCCGTELFTSADKFDSSSGWPSFVRPIAGGVVEEKADHGLGMTRTEILCARCDAHLGHVFDDGPAPTGNRYCINSASLTLKPASTTPEQE